MPCEPPKGAASRGTSLRSGSSCASQRRAVLSHVHMLVQFRRPKYGPSSQIWLCQVAPRAPRALGSAPSAPSAGEPVPAGTFRPDIGTIGPARRALERAPSGWR